MKKLVLLYITCTLFIFAKSQISYDTLDQLLQAYHEVQKFNGSALVAVKGNILLKKSYGFKNFNQQTLNDENTLYQIASVTKTFTATLIMKLVDSGKMNLSDKLSLFYPQLPSANLITIEHLLTHTSGISDRSTDTAFKLYKGNDEHSFIAFMKERALDFLPGTQFAYSNSGYILLGYIAQKITGKTYFDAVRTHLFAPSTITKSGFDFANLQSPDRATGYWTFPTNASAVPATVIDSTAPRAAGAIYSDISDLYRWHQALQSGKLISHDLQKKAYTSNQHQYGYGWQLDSMYGKKIVFHGGDIWGFQSLMMRVPQEDVCIILLSNIEEGDLTAIGKKLLAIIDQQPYLLPARDRIQLTQAQLESCVGAYEMQPGMIIQVERNEKRLWMKTNIRQPLYAQSVNEFLIEQGMDQKIIRFEVDDARKVVALSFQKNGKQIRCLKK